MTMMMTTTMMTTTTRTTTTSIGLEFGLCSLYRRFVKEKCYLRQDQDRSGFDFEKMGEEIDKWGDVSEYGTTKEGEMMEI